MFGGIASITMRAPWRRSRRTVSPLDPDVEQTSTVYQVGTMDALLAGAYAGVAELGELLDQGDFGLGCLEALDGELLVVDGLAYRLRPGGAAEPVGIGERTPFALTLPFAPTVRRGLDWTEGFDLERLVDRLAKGTGLIQAVRVDGTFRRMKVTATARQQPPYLPYAEAAAGTAEAVWQDVAGTLLGFRTPASLDGLTGSGFRFHFIDEERRRGGRVVDFTVERATLSLHIGVGLRLAVLPQTKGPSSHAA
jgi:acetolactate decarboxylase